MGSGLSLAIAFALLALGLPIQAWAMVAYQRSWMRLRTTLIVYAVGAVLFGAGCGLMYFAGPARTIPAVLGFD